jgi:hypothetical protein
MGRWGHDSDDWKDFDPTTLASPETLRKMRKARRERLNDSAPARRVEATPEITGTITSRVIKEIMWSALIEDSSMSIDEIHDLIELKTGHRHGSRLLIGNLRSEFRLILNFF